MKSTYFEILQKKNIERASTCTWEHTRANRQAKEQWVLFVLFFRLLCRYDILQNKTEKMIKSVCWCNVSLSETIYIILFLNHIHTFARMCVRVASAAVTKGPKTWWLRQDGSLVLVPVTVQGEPDQQAALLHRDFQRQADNGWVVFNTRLSKLLPCKLRCWARHWGRMRTSLPLPPAGETFLLSSHLVAGETETFSSRWAATSSFNSLLGKGFQWKASCFHHSHEKGVLKNIDQAICSFYFKVNGVLKVLNFFLRLVFIFHYEHAFLL